MKIHLYLDDCGGVPPFMETFVCNCDMMYIENDKRIDGQYAQTFYCTLYITFHILCICIHDITLHYIAHTHMKTMYTSYCTMIRSIGIRSCEVIPPSYETPPREPWLT